MSGIVAAALLIAPGYLCAEQVNVQFDEREWETGYTAEDGTKGITELVLKGETVNAWTELVTIQAFFGLQERATPQMYMNEMIDALKKACPSAKWDLIRKGDNDVLFDWEIAQCPGQEDQYEVDRVLAGAKALYVVHYATKKVPVGADTREKWIRLLSAATLSE